LSESDNEFSATHKVMLMKQATR